MIIAVIFVLIIIIIALMLYNISIHKKIETFNNINQKVTNLSIVQDFLDTINEEMTVEQKIKKINEIIIKKYAIDYSTIVVYDGIDYQIKATNVDEKHWETLKNLNSEPIFKDSIQNAIPKYITIKREGDRLPYQKMEYARAKSAMFFPLYIDNVYIGYWIMEGSKQNQFNTIDTNVLEVIRNNIVSVLRAVSNQSIIEKIVKKDKFTQVNTAEYLYGEGKRIIDKYVTSTIVMFRVINIEEVNEKYGREIGNKLIIELGKIIKESLSKEYLFVRYMGPKFVIAFSGIDTDAVVEYMRTLNEQIQEIKIDTDVEDEYVTPLLNVAVSTYYKGVALENIINSLEVYLDSADKDESNINYI